jgi:transposase
MREEPVMTRGITFVGMDVHKSTINVAVLEEGKPAPTEWVLENRATAVEKLAQKLKRAFGDAVSCCYEAGPCGFALMRDLTSAGIKCVAIAPALIPKR